MTKPTIRCFLWFLVCSTALPAFPQTIQPPPGADLEWWGGKFHAHLERIDQDVPPTKIRIVVGNGYDHDIRVLSYDIQIVKGHWSQAYTPNAREVQLLLEPGAKGEFELNLSDWPLTSVKNGKDAGTALEVAMGIGPEELQLTVGVKYWSKHYSPTGSESTAMAHLGPWIREDNNWVLKNNPEVNSAERSASHQSSVVPDDYISRYYLHPDPSLIPDAMMEWDKADRLRLGHMVPAGFLSEVFRQNEHRIEEWSETVWQLSDSSREYVWLSLWFSDTPTSRRLLEAAVGKESGQVAESAANLAGRPLTAPAVEREIDSPEVLDLLWGCFFATGRAEFVVRIISCLEWTIEGNAGTAASQLIGNAAQWSLKSNAAEHERVLEICRTQRLEHSPDTQRILQDIIDEVTTNG